jgi:hypothetical protein
VNRWLHQQTGARRTPYLGSIERGKVRIRIGAYCAIAKAPPIEADNLLTTILTVLPIFAVIAAGFGCGRFSLLGPPASGELNRFVVYLALPSLLFEV